MLKYLRNSYVREDGRKSHMVIDQKENVIIYEKISTCP